MTDNREQTLPFNVDWTDDDWETSEVVASFMHDHDARFFAMSAADQHGLPHRVSRGGDEIEVFGAL